LIKRYQACADAAEVKAVQETIIAELEDDYAKRRAEGAVVFLNHIRL
jgi:hypothetical protein